MRKAFQLLIISVFVLAFSTISIFGQAATTPKTTPTNMVYNCSLVRDGNPLSENEGVLRIVIPDEKK